MDETSFTIQRLRSKREGGGAEPMGTVSDLVKMFRPLNTSPDQPDGVVMYGPGMRIQFLDEFGAPILKLSGVVTTIHIEVLEFELFKVLFEGTMQEHPGQLAKTVQRSGWTLVNVETGYSFPRPRDDPEDDPEAESGADSDTESDDSAARNPSCSNSPGEPNRSASRENTGTDTP